MTTPVLAISGTVKFYDNNKGFGFIRTPKGDAFIKGSVVGDLSQSLYEGARVEMSCTAERINGQYKLEVVHLLKVQAPTVLLTTVKWFNPLKGFGFAECADAGFSKDQAFLHMTVAKQAGIIPVDGTPMRATIIESQKGPCVTHFEWGPEIDTAWKAQTAAVAPDATVKQSASEVLEVSAPAIPSEEPQPAAVELAPKKRAPKSKSHASKKSSGDLAEMVQKSAKRKGGIGSFGDAMQAAFSAPA